MQTRIEITKPIDRIDVRTFDHDVKVMQSRLLLEQFEKVYNWQSDRQLKAIYAEYYQGRGSRDAAPDGVYKSVSGKLIAFEYEIAQKSKKRYRDKISKYVGCIRQRNYTNSPKYDYNDYKELYKWSVTISSRICRLRKFFCLRRRLKIPFSVEQYFLSVIRRFLFRPSRLHAGLQYLCPRQQCSQLRKVIKQTGQTNSRPSGTNDSRV